ncbi:glycosyltransferase [Bacillus songklensis]|uniref:Glycosyltransferase n=1 Tax=Bacillus songklensis TaxID=1069116 RepID=A0ABV8AZC5_9BACI
MKKHQLIVIHAHFPYLYKTSESYCDETLLFEDMIQWYIPLLRHLNTKTIPPCTITFSPIVLEIWDHPMFQDSFLQYLKKLNRRDLVTLFLGWDCNLINGFRALYDAGEIECIPTTASHCLLPYLSTRKGKQVQINLGIKIFEKYFQKRPMGFWAEEGFVTEEIEELFHEEGIKYTFLHEQFLPKEVLFDSFPLLTSRNVLLIPYKEGVCKKVSGEMKALPDVMIIQVSHRAGCQKIFSFFKMFQEEEGNFQLPKQFFIEDLHCSSKINMKIELNKEFSERWLNKQNHEAYSAMHQMEQILWECMDHIESSRFLKMLKKWLLVSSKEWAQLLTKNNGKKEYIVAHLNIHIRQFKQFYESFGKEVPISKQISDSIFHTLTVDYLKFLRTSFKNQRFTLQQTEKEQLNILMLSWEFPPLVVGGLSRHVFDLSRALAKQGHHVVVMTTFVEGLPAYEKFQGVHVYRVLSLQPHHSDFFAWVNSLNAAMVRESLILCKKIKFHLVHAHDWLVGSAAQIIHKQLNIPLISTIHATEHGRNNGIHTTLQKTVHEKEKRLIHHSQAVIVCSEYMKNELVDLFYVSPKKISVFPNGIDAQMFLAQCQSFNIHKKYELSSDSPIVFSIGRIVYEKGFHILIEAAEFVIRKIPNVRFVIAGKGPLLHEYRELVKEKRLGGHVQFIGYITDEERNHLLDLCNVVVFPSLYEPFGIVALEGMIVGKPTVVTDTGGLQAIVEDGVSGVKVRPSDAQHLAEQIIFLLKNEEWANQLGKNGKKRAETMFSWDQIARDTTRLFERNIFSFQKGGGRVN